MHDDLSRSAAPILTRLVDALTVRVRVRLEIEAIDEQIGALNVRRADAQRRMDAAGGDDQGAWRDLENLIREDAAAKARAM